MKHKHLHPNGLNKDRFQTGSIFLSHPNLFHRKTKRQMLLKCCEDTENGNVEFDEFGCFIPSRVLCLWENNQQERLTFFLLTKHLFTL